MMNEFRNCVPFSYIPSVIQYVWILCAWINHRPTPLSFPTCLPSFQREKKGSTLRGGKDLVLNNAEESIFLFVNRLQIPHNPSKSAIFKLKGICLNLPQDLLMCWGLGSIDEVLRPFMTWAEEMSDTNMPKWQSSSNLRCRSPRISYRSEIVWKETWMVRSRM